MKGIILAGGTGSRLHPITLGVSKQLLPVYDKPLVYYPLSTLILAGIDDIVLISTPADIPQFERLLGDGSRFGISLSYVTQPSPDGLAQAFLLSEHHLAGSPAALILGDNLFYGPGLGLQLQQVTADSSATIFGAWVAEPRAYGVVEFDQEGRAISLEEKPERPRSHYAVPGLYFYPGDVVEQTKTLRPSSRGELEITDLNRLYLDQDRLTVDVLKRGAAWLDTGTFDDLIEASNFVRTLQVRQGLRIGVPEEAAWRVGMLSDEELAQRARPLLKSGYGSYLMELLVEGLPRNDGRVRPR